MIYAIAAYSITIGALALYAVVLQHRARSLRAEQASSPPEGSQPAPLDPRRGFNIGAALLSPIWMWAHGMRIAGLGLGVICLVLAPLYARAMWIPLVFVGIVPLAAAAALAVVGNRIGVAHTGLEDAAAFSATQVPWAVAGIVLYTIVLPWAWYFTSAAG